MVDRHYRRIDPSNGIYYRTVPIGQVPRIPNQHIINTHNNDTLHWVRYMLKSEVAHFMGPVATPLVLYRGLESTIWHCAEINSYFM